MRNDGVLILLLLLFLIMDPSKMEISDKLMFMAKWHLNVPEVKRRKPADLDLHAKDVYKVLTERKHFEDGEDRATAAFYLSCALLHT